MSQGCPSGGHHDAEREELEERMRAGLARVKRKLLVLSGKGGVGKSTVAVNLAVALAQGGARTGLLDVDLHGPSVPVMLGLGDARPKSDGTSLFPVPVAPQLHVISISMFLTGTDEAVVWRGPLKIGAIRQLLGDVNWGDLDYLVIDSPPGTGDEPLTIAQDVPGVEAVVVTTPQEVSLSDVRRSITFCRMVNMPVAGVIENMSGYVCPHCGAADDLFGRGGGERMATALDVPFLGAIPIDRRLVESGDRGRPLVLDAPDSPAAGAYRAVVARLTASPPAAGG